MTLKKYIDYDPNVCDIKLKNLTGRNLTSYINYYNNSYYWLTLNLKYFLLSENIPLLLFRK